MEWELRVSLMVTIGYGVYQIVEVMIGQLPTIAK
jgi:hypothetical protein